MQCLNIPLGPARNQETVRGALTWYGPRRRRRPACARKSGFLGTGRGRSGPYPSHPSTNGNRSAHSAASLGSASTRRTTPDILGATS
jgi:hypothetical protein